MKPEYLELLRCPKTRRKLELRDAEHVNNRIKKGMLVEPHSGSEYPIIGFIPRFVPTENYASSFGLQWNIHSRTQHDKYSHHSISGERYRKETQWEENLTGQYILEVGGGSGRFTVHAAKSGVTIVSIDYSNAVEANYKINGDKENVFIVQGDIYAMPFAKECFDKVFCFGVLQHTPDPQKAFLSALDYLRPGGKIASDIYIKDIVHWLLFPKYYVRPFTKRKDPEKLYRSVCRYVDFMWPLAKIIRKIPRIGYAINWRLLIADYSKHLPNSDDAILKEWAYLDTFDMLSPTFDYPQTLRNFKKWHKEAGLSEIDVHVGYNGIEGRATKPIRNFNAQ